MFSLILILRASGKINWTFLLSFFFCPINSKISRQFRPRLSNNWDKIIFVFATSCLRKRNRRRFSNDLTLTWKLNQYDLNLINIVRARQVDVEVTVPYTSATSQEDAKGKTNIVRPPVVYYLSAPPNILPVLDNKIYIWI